MPGAHVQEDRGAAAADDRAGVVLDRREVAVLGRDAPERFAGTAERRLHAARNVAERVVCRRAHVLVPPVTADEAVVTARDARVRRDPIDGVADAIRPRRRCAVALALVRGEPASAEPCLPRAADALPAPAAAPPELER